MTPTQAMLMIAQLISVVYELGEKGIQYKPLGPMYLAFMDRGVSHEEFEMILKIGEQIKIWTRTNETIELTDLGSEKAKLLERKLKAMET